MVELSKLLTCASIQWKLKIRLVFILKGLYMNLHGIVATLRKMITGDRSGDNSSSSGAEEGGNSPPDKRTANKEVMKNWYADKYDSVLIQRNILIFLVLLSFVLVAIGLFSIKKLQEAHRVEPFVISVDRNTGNASVVEPLSSEIFTADKVVKEYFMMKFITAREEYNAANADYNKDVVKLLSTSPVYNEYYRAYRGRDENNIPEKYGNKSRISLKLKSISYESDTRALVRVSLISSGVIQKREEKVILIEFKFQNLNLNEKQRLINPLGFQTTFYRITNESTGV